MYFFITRILTQAIANLHPVMNMKTLNVRFVQKLRTQINLTSQRKWFNVSHAKIKVYVKSLFVEKKHAKFVFLFPAHPSCVEMSARMFQRTLAYKWQCVNCKTCSKCRKAKDNKMLYCVQCDRGFHIYCLGLRNVPDGKNRS